MVTNTNWPEAGQLVAERAKLEHGASVFQVRRSNRTATFPLFVMTNYVINKNTDASKTGTNLLIWKQFAIYEQILNLVRVCVPSELGNLEGPNNLSGNMKTETCHGDSK